MNIDIRDFCENYLSVDHSEYDSFFEKNQQALRQIFRRYGKPLSEKMNKISFGSKPLRYGTYDYEFMLKRDFGKYGGTQDADIVDVRGDIVVYTFKNDPPQKTERVLSPSQTMLSTIKIGK